MEDTKKIINNAGPSHTQEGSSLTRSGPCSTQAGPSSYHLGPSSDQAGPSHTQFDEFKIPYPPNTGRKRKKGKKCLEEEIKRLQEEEDAIRLEEELMRLEEEELKMLEKERALGLDEEEVMRLEDEELMRLDDEEAMSLGEEEEEEEEEEAMRLQERKLGDEPSRVTSGPCSPLAKHPLTKPKALMGLDERKPQNKKDPDTARVGHLDFRADDHFASEDPASPSNIPAGPSLTQTGPCSTQAGPSLYQSDPFSNQAGSSHTQAGPHTQNTFQLQTGKVKCADCKMVFASNSNLRRHIQTAHEKDPSYLVCDKCGCFFLRTDSLQRHIRSNHISKPTSDIQAEYPCAECGVKLTSAYERHRHSRFTCPSLKECKLCKKVLATHANLRRHMNTVHGEGRTVFECPHCGKRSRRRDSLQVHINTVHSLSKPGCYRCPKCGCDFICESNLTRHLSLGCNIPPLFCCSKCPFKSAFKTVLNNHMLTQHEHEHNQ